MTINKEQPVSDAVSDAMIEAGFNAAGSRRYWLDEDSLSAIYLAMKAASHPLEQQQAVSGDEVKRALHKAIKGTAVCHETGLTNAEINELVAAARAALTASGMGRMREALESIEGFLPVEGPTPPYVQIATFAKQTARTALQEEGVERRD